MDNLDDSQNGQPGATNAGHDQGATGTTALGNSALGYVMVNTGQGTPQTALYQGGIQRTKARDGTVMPRGQTRVQNSHAGFVENAFWLAGFDL